VRRRLSLFDMRPSTAATLADAGHSRTTIVDDSGSLVASTNRS